MRGFTRCTLATLIVACLAGPALAGPSFTWSFQDTRIAPAGIYQTAVAMRAGQAWPVIFTDASGGSAYSLFPGAGTGTSSPPNSGSWLKIGGGFFPGSVSRIRSATSPDGRAALTGSLGDTGLGGVVSGRPSGWGGLPIGTKAVAFDLGGNMVSATRNTVSGVGSLPSTTPIVDMDISPFGEIGVIDATLKYWHYSQWTGTWLSTQLTDSRGPTIDGLDIEFDSLGRPHVLASAGPYITAFDFSTVTGAWSASLLTSTAATQFAALAANDDGTIGTSYVAQGGTLVYAYKNDNAEWSSTNITGTGTYTQKLVGITYDYADLPVISYIGNSSTGAPFLMLAYDPIVVPEPSALALLGLGALCLLRRARR